MNSLNDQRLLRDYSECRSERAFAELVRRHVDFVYSAALRMVRDTHLAEDVTQSVFVALAQNAGPLTDRAVLSGWLHRTTQNLAANAVRSDVRRRTREKEAAAMNELLTAEPDRGWEHIAPHLDAALGKLSDADRDALLLRYFERKSAREMAQTLGVSEDAAQKRVNRAVERLREFFAQRGVTVGASGLVVVISANAVQAAPVELAVTISTAAALAGTTVATTATVTAVKTIAMTTLQKTSIAAVIAASVATCLVIQHQAQTKLREENQSLRQQLGQQSQLEMENQHLSDVIAQTARTNSQSLPQAQFNELLRLRGEVGRLRKQERELKTRLTEKELSSAPADVARIKLPYAEAELARLTQLHAEKLASDNELREAEFTVELLKAEANGDSAEAARSRLRHAEAALERISALYSQKLVDQTEYNKAKHEVELRRAEENGDRAEIARTRLRQAEEELARLSELHQGKLISDTEFNTALVNLELLRAQIAP